MSHLAEGGVLVSSVSQPDPVVAARYGVRAEYFILDVTTQRLESIASRIERESLRISVGTIVPLADAKLAHDRLAGTAPHPRGSIVLRLDS